ncbi:FAD-dependent monooxygenase [Kineosporia babensis]|uniref:FAD-dependent monooxygenase n=1 Tax=Kineosporia babensis TaxID=499548 RepID=A0A9X1NEQ9_9ACTN|nr:FAD-dependent monooxygenase [Kineosporia babensis]
MEPAADPERPQHLPDEVDVLIVGAGPAGLAAFAQLAQFPGISTRLIERRAGRLEIGQADGLQARSIESFQAFGFAQRVIEESYRIYSMAFWRPDPERPTEIVRTRLVPDDPSGISEFPHLILNQARVLDYFAEFAFNSPARAVPDYGVEFVGLEVTGDAVLVTVRQNDQERVIRAKYVLGCDGARSQVREAIGRKLVGQAAMHAWGVMDVLANTDFPDFRTKCAIQSHDGRNILLIPREGGYLTRFYVDLGEVPKDDAGSVRRTPLVSIVEQANRILHPYRIEVQDVPWWSVYEVGHRLTDKFHDADESPKVFITGDACHTHSAKAGQGMNVSIQDGWNIAWKLGHVLDGRARPELLETYSAERQVVAQNLIAFDKEWSALMAMPADQMPDPAHLEDFYVKTFEFPAGFMTQYQPSMLTAQPTHQHLATGFPIGKRFKSALVHRVSDTTPVHLGHHARADGRWRIYVFADNGEKAHGLAAELTVQEAWFDLKIIYQQPFAEVQIQKVPAVFRPKQGRLQVTDWERIYATGDGHDIFAERGISRDGAIVVVRPDQYVANVLPLTAGDELTSFFAGIQV